MTRNPRLGLRTQSIGVAFVAGLPIGTVTAVGCTVEDLPSQTAGKGGTGSSGKGGVGGTAGIAGASSGSGGDSSTRGGEGGESGSPGAGSGDPNATCTDVPSGTFTCTCNSEYTGNGTTCAPIVSGASCSGLASTCGPSGDDDCCAANLVPGGTFDRSNDPAYPATLSDYRLDTYEITVGRFRKFAAAYGPGWRPGNGSGKNPNNPADAGWDSAAWNASLPADAAALTGPNGVRCSGTQTWTPSAGTSVSESRPQNCLDWFVAYAFCIWDGGRLPTEAEWNYAAAGGDEQREYPWSSPPSSTTIDGTHASYDCLGDGVAGCSVTDLVVVGSKAAGNARWGQADMAGNVWEWEQDWYGTEETPCTNCVNPPASFYNRVLRGGSFVQEDETAYRSWDRSYYEPPSVRYPNVGARCARGAR